MIIRPVKKEEYQYTEELVFEVFRHTAFSDGIIEKALVKDIREGRFYIPELDLVVEENGAIIGHFILSKFPICKQNETQVLLLSPVSVATDKQKQGIGTFMIKEGIKLAVDLGFKGIIVEGDWRYYRRFGFKTSTEFNIFASEKNLPPSKENLMAMELCNDGLANITGEVDYSIYSSLVN